MAGIFVKILFFLDLLVVVHSKRETPRLRITTNDPTFTEGETMSIYCRTETLNISDISFRLSNNVNQSLRGLEEEIRDKTRVLNSTLVVLETEAAMKWDGVFLECCNVDVCLDLVKIKICYEVPNVTITSFKIFNWNDLFIQWSAGSDRPDIITKVSYKVDVYDNLDDDFTTCTKDGDSCTVSGFYKGLSKTDVAVRARVVLSNMCGSSKNDSVGPRATEEMIQMKPVENLRTEVVHADASESTEGSVVILFSVDPPYRMVSANLKCECASAGFEVADTLTVTNSSSYTLTYLPTFVSCTCRVKVRSLGLWSEAALTTFMSPQKVPRKSPNFIAFHKKACFDNTVEVVLFVESLSLEESRGTLEHVNVTTAPCWQCHLLPQDALNKCQNNQSYGCSGRLEYWPYLALSSTSKTINVSLKAENKAGASSKMSHQTINLDVKDVITNFSVVRTDNGNLTLSWDFKDQELPKSVVVVWCQWNYQNCQWKDLDNSSTSYTINSSLVWGQSTVFGVGGRHKDGALPPLHLKNNICLGNALPLAPSIGLNRVATPNAIIDFFQPSCNNTGLPYLQKIQLLRVDKVTNKTDIVLEKEVHASESTSEKVILEIPDIYESNYMIQAFSQSQGGLSQSSNRINVNLSDPKSPDMNATIVASALIAVLVILLLPLAIFMWCRWKKKNDKKILISVPKDAIEYDIVDMTSHPNYSTLRTSSRSSCSSHSSRSNHSNHSSQSIDDLPQARDVIPDKASSHSKSASTSHSKTASTSSEPEDYQLATVVNPKDERAADLDTSGCSANWYQKCGKMNQLPVATLLPDTFASPISNFGSDSDSVFFEGSNSSEPKRLSDYSRVTLDRNPVDPLGFQTSVV